MSSYVQTYKNTVNESDVADKKKKEKKEQFAQNVVHTVYFFSILCWIKTDDWATCFTKYSKLYMNRTVR